MFVTRRRMLCLAVLMGVGSWSGSLADRCLYYYDDVSLTGRLVQQTYPGPPDFESVTRGDKPLVIWLLQLDDRVCIEGSSASYPNVYNERELQIVLGADQYARTEPYAAYRHLLGKRIGVTGRLSPGGGRYEKPYVITTRTIEELF